MPLTESPEIIEMFSFELQIYFYILKSTYNNKIKSIKSEWYTMYKFHQHQTYLLKNYQFLHVYQGIKSQTPQGLETKISHVNLSRF